MRWLSVLVLAGCGVVTLGEEAPQEAPRVGVDAPRVTVETPAASACRLSQSVVDFGVVEVGGVAYGRLGLLGCFGRPHLEELSTHGAIEYSFDGAWVDFVYRPTRAGETSAMLLRVHTGDASHPSFEVPVYGKARFDAAVCEDWSVSAKGEVAPNLAAVGDRIHLLAEAPPAEGLRKQANVFWRLVARPHASDAQITEQVSARGRSSDDPRTPEAGFTVDAPGLYRLEAEVHLPSALGCPVQRHSLYVEACPCEGEVQVELLWSGLAGGAELRFAHPLARRWGERGMEVNSSVHRPHWPEARPSLYLREGLARMRVEALQPEALYRVAVERTGRGPVAVQLRIFFAGRLYQRRTVLDEANNFWDAAGLRTGEAPFVVPYDRSYSVFDGVPPLNDRLNAGMPCLPDHGPRCAPLQCEDVVTGSYGVCLTE